MIITRLLNLHDDDDLICNIFRCDSHLHGPSSSRIYSDLAVFSGI